MEFDEILISGNENDLNEYMWDYDKNIVVDWRGEDDEIVRGVAEKINDPSLFAEYTDDELKIYFRDNEYILPYSLFSDSGKARYVTINKVRELIKDNYEIRVWKESTLYDTHSFYVQKNDWWKFMDEKFSDRINQLFIKIDENTEFE